MEAVAVIIQNPFVSMTLITLCVFLAVSAAKILGITRIGPVVITPQRINVVSELIREITKLEVERQLAPDRVKSACRRIVKDASDQSKAILRGLFNGEDYRSIDTVLAGPVNNFIVSEVMTIVEKNHIAEMEREAWQARKRDEFRAKMLGLSQVLVDYWPKEDLGDRDPEQMLRDVTVDMFYTWDNMFEHIREIAMQTAKRNAEIGKEIDCVMSHYRKHGRLPESKNGR